MDFCGTVYVRRSQASKMVDGQEYIGEFDEMCILRAEL